MVMLAPTTALVGEKLTSCGLTRKLRSDVSVQPEGQSHRAVLSDGGDGNGQVAARCGSGFRRRSAAKRHSRSARETLSQDLRCCTNVRKPSLKFGEWAQTHIEAEENRTAEGVALGGATEKSICVLHQPHIGGKS